VVETVKDPRRELLERVLVDVANNGLADRSLRSMAQSIGSSHRMLNYHFGSADGLVAAIVAEVELQQRQIMRTLATSRSAPAEVIRGLWTEASSPAMRPFVRLFYEAVTQAAHGRPGTEGFLESLTDTWLDDGTQLATSESTTTDRAQIRLGMAVMRGLLLDVIAANDAADATVALEVFLDIWENQG